MEFIVNGKERELKFGIGFIRKLDEIYKAEFSGIEFGMGLNMAHIQLQQYNPSTLSEVIKAAIKGNVTLRSVDEAVENYADENDGLGTLFEEVIESMGKSPVVKDSLTKTQKLAEEADDQA